jgi:hypothetical protein
MRRHVPSLLPWIAIALVSSLVAACDPGPPELATETTALEAFLLSADEVGDGYTWREGGGVSTDVGHLCPDSDVSIGSFGAVRALFTKPRGDDELSVEELLWTDEPEALDQLMADLSTAFTNCDGIEWDYYGEKMVLEVIEAPSLGDSNIAIRQLGPSIGEESFRVYVRRENVMALIRVDEDSVTLYEIASAALDKLP